MNSKFLQWTLRLLIPFFIFGSNSFAKDRVVVIIDTGLDINDSRFSASLCPGGHRDFVGDGLQDDIGHGTHVFGQIQKYAPKSGWCAVIIKFWGKNTKNGRRGFAKAIAYLLELRPDYVNYSGGGAVFDASEYLMIKLLPQTKFIVAAGNEGKNISRPYNAYYPANYPLDNIIPVESIDKYGKLSVFSNFGLKKFRYELGENVLSTIPCKLRSRLVPGCNGYMSGTSMSTAISTGKIISEDFIDRKISSR